MKVEAVGFYDPLASVYQQHAVSEMESLHSVFMEAIPLC
jgi:hypothetical protein